jgi:hypothetical protein
MVEKALAAAHLTILGAIMSIPVMSAGEPREDNLSTTTLLGDVSEWSRGRAGLSGLTG